MILGHSLPILQRHFNETHPEMGQIRWISGDSQLGGFQATTFSLKLCLIGWGDYFVACNRIVEDSAVDFC